MTIILLSFIAGALFALFFDLLVCACISKNKMKVHFYIKKCGENHFLLTVSNENHSSFYIMLYKSSLRTFGLSEDELDNYVEKKEIFIN